jgi:predicted ABC-type ATPase
MGYTIELSDTLNERIFEKIKKKYLLDIQPFTHTQGIILGGQPGSGKSFLQRKILKEFNESFIFISTDDLRLYHPAYLELQQNPETVQNAANLVNPYASAWTEKLIAYCIENKYNLIIDSTLGGNIEAVYNTIEKFKGNNYQVHLRIMAVPAIVSKLSIFLRYETQLAEKGFARWTRMEDHDDRFEKLAENIPKIISTKKLDSFGLYKRILGEKGTDKIEPVFNIVFRNREDVMENVTFRIQNHFKTIRDSMIEEDKIYLVSIANRIKAMIFKRGGEMREFEAFEKQYF